MIFVIGTLLILKWLELIEGSESAINFPFNSPRSEVCKKESSTCQPTRLAFSNPVARPIYLKEQPCRYASVETTYPYLHVHKRDLSFQRSYVPLIPKNEFVFPTRQKRFNPLSLFRAPTKSHKQRLKKKAYRRPIGLRRRNSKSNFLKDIDYYFSEAPIKMIRIGGKQGHSVFMHQGNKSDEEYWLSADDFQSKPSISEFENYKTKSKMPFVSKEDNLNLKEPFVFLRGSKNNLKKVALSSITTNRIFSSVNEESVTYGGSTDSLEGYEEGTSLDLKIATTFQEKGSTGTSECPTSTLHCSEVDSEDVSIKSAISSSKSIDNMNVPMQSTITSTSSLDGHSESLDPTDDENSTFAISENAGESEQQITSSSYMDTRENVTGSTDVKQTFASEEEATEGELQVDVRSTTCSSSSDFDQSEYSDLGHEHIPNPCILKKEIFSKPKQQVLLLSSALKSSQSDDPRLMKKLWNKLRLTEPPTTKRRFSKMIFYKKDNSGFEENSFPVKPVYLKSSSKVSPTVVTAALQHSGDLEGFESFDDLYNHFAGKTHEPTTVYTFATEDIPSELLHLELTTSDGIADSANITVAFRKVEGPPISSKVTEEALSQGTPDQTTKAGYDVKFLESLFDNNSVKERKHNLKNDILINSKKPIAEDLELVLTMSPSESPFENSLINLRYHENPKETTKKYDRGLTHMNSNLKAITKLSSSELSYLFDFGHSDTFNSKAHESTTSFMKPSMLKGVSDYEYTVGKGSHWRRSGIRKHARRKKNRIARYALPRRKMRNKILLTKGCSKANLDNYFIDTKGDPVLRLLQFQRRNSYSNPYRRKLKALSPYGHSKESRLRRPQVKIYQKEMSGAGFAKKFDDDSVAKGMHNLMTKGKLGVQDALSKRNRYIDRTTYGSLGFSGNNVRLLKETCQNQQPYMIFAPVIPSGPVMGDFKQQWDNNYSNLRIGFPVTVPPPSQIFKSDLFRPHHNAYFQARMHSCPHHPKKKEECPFHKTTSCVHAVHHVSPPPLLSYEVGFQIPLPNKQILMNLKDSRGNVKALALSLGRPVISLDQGVKLLLSNRTFQPTPFTIKFTTPFSVTSSTNQPYSSCRTSLLNAVNFGTTPSQKVFPDQSSSFTTPNQMSVISDQSKLQNYVIIIPTSELFDNHNDPSCQTHSITSSTLSDNFLLINHLLTCKSSLSECSTKAHTEPLSTCNEDRKLLSQTTGQLDASSTTQSNNVVWSTCYTVA